MIVQRFNLNLIPNQSPVVVHVNQYDTGTGRLIATLYEGNEPYSPSGTAVIQGTKPDGHGFQYTASLDGNVVTADLTEQMSPVAGDVRAQIVVTESSGETGTFVFIMRVQPSALPSDADMSESDYPLIEEAIREAQEAVQTAQEAVQRAKEAIAETQENAEDSEAWAQGTRGGIPVEPTDPTYEHNAEYWAHQAEGAVSGVSSFNGRSGSVLPIAGDYDSEKILLASALHIGGETQNNVQEALEALEGNKADIEQIYADNGVLGAKNLLNVTANTQTLNGVTFTVNRDSDGNVLNVNVNGTPSSDIYFRINSKFSEVGRYILNGILGGSNTFRMQAYIYASSDDTFKRSYTDIGSGTEVVIDDGEYANFEIIVTQSGGAVNNKKVYPMLRLASDPDDTYQPYAMTNRELTNGKADKTDLTSIIATGSTNATGSTITNGKYFYLNGTLVRAKADIANGATFTLNTNYEPVTAGSLNELAANNLGGVVDITSYTSSPYICPHDGIITIRAASQGAYCTASILGADGDNSKGSNVTVSAPTSSENDSCFNVKKGMQLYCRSKSGSAYLLYNPIV